MFFWAATSINGWSPKLDPTARYITFGIVDSLVVDLFPGGAPAESTLYTAGAGADQFWMGWPDATQCYASRFESPGELISYAVGTWTPTTILTSDDALGNVIGASLNHWGTWIGATNRYIVDGSLIVPAGASPSGFGIDGQWIAYVTTGNLVNIATIAGASHRIVTPTTGTPGSIGAWRIFEGPDGGYLFYVANGAIWINTPTNQNLQANLPNTSASEGFGALQWLSGALWVWTYAFNPGDGIWYALGRPVGDSQCIQLANVAANNLSMQIGQRVAGWVVAGANDNLLTAWVEVPYTTTRSSFLGSSGGGSVPGGSTYTPGASGKGVLDRRAAPPPAVKEPRVYPHVPKIADFHTQQSVKLAWDQLSGQAETVRALQATVEAQATELADLKAAITALQTGSNAAYKGVGE